MLAQQQNARAVALAARDFASRQSSTKATRRWPRREADLALKRAQLAAARAGPTAEERALADARVALAEATVAELQARLAKTRLVAPADGTVGILVAEPGEIVPVGKPVLTLDVGGERWFAFTLREDALGGLTVGSEVDAQRPTTAGASPRSVTELRPLGEFATWRAARAVGDHDLNSFRLRLDPVEAKDDGLAARHDRVAAGGRRDGWPDAQADIAAAIRSCRRACWPWSAHRHPHPAAPLSRRGAWSSSSPSSWR